MPGRVPRLMISRSAAVRLAKRRRGLESETEARHGVEMTLAPERPAAQLAFSSGVRPAPRQEPRIDAAGLDRCSNGDGGAGG